MNGDQVARTLDPAVHALRRDEFVDVALRLMQTKGWDATSIADVLAETGASKGAFYHYFSSKADLLEAVIERITEAATASLHPAIDAPGLSAIERFELVFRGIARWKNDRTELLLAVVQTWSADENAIVREKFRKGVVRRMVPLLASIIAQGQAEGRFAGLDPEATARVLVALMLGANETATDLYLDRLAGTISFETVERRLTAYQTAFERVLDLPSGSLVLVDRGALVQWFG
jgi:AcrR family transcriptional regulator